MTSMFDSGKTTNHFMPISQASGARAVDSPLYLYVVPNYISAAMRRAKLNTVDITKFSAFKNVLTNSDYADWWIEADLVNALTIQGIRVLEPCVGLESYWLTVTDEDRCLIQRDILPLTKFPQRKSDGHKRLTEPSAPGVDSSDAALPYRFELMRDGIIMFIESGFLSFIENGTKETQLTFLRQLLKSAYGQVPTFEANRRFANAHCVYTDFLLQQSS